MMRYFYKILFGTLLFTGFLSCNKFLDEPQRSSYSLINSTNAVLQSLNNDVIFTTGPFAGVWSSDDYYYTDAGFKSQDQPKRDFYLYAAGTVENSLQGWLPSYNKIYIANVALEALANIEKEDPGMRNDNNFKLAKGFALFARSYSFYEIAQLYASPYIESTASQALGIPIRLTTNINESTNRASLKVTYDQIVNDLKEALELVPKDVISPTRPSKATIYGMLARTYLSMGKYVLAGEAANNCLNQFGLQILDYNLLPDKNSPTPFTRFHKEIIYHSTIRLGRITVMNVDSMLYKSYSDQDLRKLIFFKPKTGVDRGRYTFSCNYDQDTQTWFNGIAADEILLIRAECYARAGKVLPALDDLNYLLKYRWSVAHPPITAGSSEEALTTILLERRKELVFRGSLRWTDLRRLNLEPDRKVTVKRRIENVNYELPPNDLRYTLLIPKDVIDNSAMQQNPR